jgi:hypothetical protein
MFEGATTTSYHDDLVYEMIYDFIMAWEDAWPLKDFFFPPNLALLAQAIRNGTAMTISDGLYKPFLADNIGAASWKMECSVSQATYFGKCDMSGLWPEVNAYQLEIQGCHAGFLGLLAFVMYHDIHGGSVTFGFFS